MENASQATPKRSKRMVVVYVVLVMGLIAAIAWPYWELKRLRHEVYWLQHNTYAWGANDTSEQLAEYKLLSQTVKVIDVMDDAKSYADNSTEVVYKKAKARIMEIEVTNNTPHIYDGYSVSAIDQNGKILNNILIPKEDSTEYAMYMSGNGISLAPGGKGSIIIIIPDEGYEITRVYDQNAGRTIKLTD